jgi:isoprenylcysteine carboxyl methyltransferase (ICMT) family protein YpbQ
MTLALFLLSVVLLDYVFQLADMFKWKNYLLKNSTVADIPYYEYVKLKPNDYFILIYEMLIVSHST